MANKSLTLHGVDDVDAFHTIEITLSVADNKWTKTEPNNASDIFKTKTGLWMRAHTITTLFAADATTKVGSLSPLDPASARKNDTGAGKSFETAVTFRWTVTNTTP